MISVDQALKIVKENAPGKRVESIPVDEADGRVISHDFFAREPSPSFDNSAMDGFAVRWDDIRDATRDRPVRLALLGESRAGIPFAGKLESGNAIAINTGAVLPSGADSVVPIEESVKHNDHIEVIQVKARNQNVRFKGNEFKAGELLIRQGNSLNPAHIGLVISQGIREIEVFARPAIAIIVTGSELVGISDVRQPGQIHDSNSPMLAAAALRAGAKVTFKETVGDSLKLTSQSMKRALGESDIIILSGGVSVGEHDYVKPAAQELGFETLIWRVNQRPGKPLFFAKKGHSLLFGLPGNPVSAMMCFLHYVVPVIRIASGEREGRATIRASLQEPLNNLSKRAQFFRVAFRENLEKTQNVERTKQSAETGKYGVFPIKHQASHMLTSLTDADGFVFLESESCLDRGDLVDVVTFPWFQERVLVLGV